MDRATTTGELQVRTQAPSLASRSLVQAPTLASLSLAGCAWLSPLSLAGEGGGEGEPQAPAPRPDRLTTVQPSSPDSAPGSAGIVLALAFGSEVRAA